MLKITFTALSDGMMDFAKLMRVMISLKVVHSQLRGWFGYCRAVFFVECAQVLVRYCRKDRGVAVMLWTDQKIMAV